MPSTPYNPVGFAGRRRDAPFGTYGFAARAYDPALGRFLQRDPAEIVDGPHLYAYVGNNPLSFTDPTGLSRKEIVRDDPGRQSPAEPHLRDATKPGREPAAPEGQHIDDKPVAKRRGYVLIDHQYVLTGRERTEAIDRVQQLTTQIRDFEAEHLRLFDSEKAKQQKLFEAERWEWPNRNTLSQAIDIGETVVGCYAGPWFCAAEVGSEIVSMVWPKEGAIAEYGIACVRGRPLACAGELASNLGSGAAKRQYEHSQRKKQSAADRIRAEIERNRSDRHAIKTKIQSMKALRENLQIRLRQEKMLRRYVDPELGELL
jgi:RHS repeat-associated protein